MDETKQAVPDFMIWHCAGCGAAAVGKTKPCDCATNVGRRDGPNAKRESTWWDEPPSDTVAVKRELLAEILEFYDGIVAGATPAPGLPNGCIVATIPLKHALGFRLDKIRALLSQKGE